MSASREKKERKAATAEPQTTGKKAGMSKGLKTTLIVAGIAMFVALVVFFTMLTGGFFATHSTAATIGTHKLSPAMVNYFYADAYSTAQNQYGDLFSYIIDTNTPLSEQVQNEETGETWADYFMTQGLEKAARVYAVYDAAIADGVTLTEDEQATIDSTVSMFDTYATLGGYANGNGYLAAVYGTGCNKSNFRDYMEITEIASKYTSDYQSSLTYTAEQIADEYAQNPNDYDTVTYRAFYLSYTDVQGDDADITDETKAAVKATAEEMAAASTGEDAYLALCVENAPEANKASYEDDSYTLRSDLAYSSIGGDQAEWLFDSARKSGDVIAQETETGYYVLYFLSRNTNDTQLVNIRHILLSATDTSDETAMAEAKQKAEDVLAEYEAGEQTEAAFAELAKTYSSDTGAGEGGLYENVYPGQMVENFNDWCFDASRQPGDVGIVETEYGYHVIYFVGRSDTTYRDHLVENALRTNDYTAWETSITDGATYTFNASAMKYTSKR